MRTTHAAADTPPVRPTHTAAAPLHARAIHTSSPSPTRSIDTDTTSQLTARLTDLAIAAEEVVQSMQLNNIFSNIKTYALMRFSFFQTRVVFQS